MAEHLLQMAKPKIPDWIRTRFRRRLNRRDDSAIAAIPAGYVVRPSSDSLILDDPNAVISGSANSSFFTKLPPEIRNQIYLYAFGQRTIHLDYRYSVALPRRTEPNDHAGIDRDGAKWIGSMSCDKPKEWRWWSSVCHRNPVEPAWFDACRVGRGVCWLFDDYAAAIQEVDTDEEREKLKERIRNGIGCASGKCFLGVRGWLGSCRQAYNETIHIVFSTNTIMIESVPLVHLLPKMLPASHLRCITSLQLVMHRVESFYERPLEEKRAWNLFREILSVVETNLPSLKTLYLSFADNISRFPFMNGDQDKLETALKRVDKMVCVMHRVRRQQDPNVMPVDIEIALHLSIFERLANMGREKGTATRFEKVGRFCFAGQRFWRPCGKQEEEELGYWVRTGMDDPEPYVQNCFGSSAITTAD